MKPGRELDAAVAEALGLAVSKEDPFVEDEDDYYLVDKNGNYSPAKPVLNYSTDIAAAFDCLAALEIKGLRWGIDNYDGVINVRIWKPEGDEPVASSEANTAPHAICLAALKALGSNNSEK